MKNEEKCPVCGDNKYTRIWINKKSFNADRNGSVNIVCCNNCGVLRVTKESLNFRHLKEQ